MPQLPEEIIHNRLWFQMYRWKEMKQVTRLTARDKFKRCLKIKKSLIAVLKIAVVPMASAVSMRNVSQATVATTVAISMCQELNKELEEI